MNKVIIRNLSEFLFPSFQQENQEHSKIIKQRNRNITIKNHSLTIQFWMPRSIKIEPKSTNSRGLRKSKTPRLGYKLRIDT